LLEGLPEGTQSGQGNRRVEKGDGRPAGLEATAFSATTGNQLKHVA
jgi:hypothetical protein